MPTELSQLKDLECYVKLPGDYPCAKIQMAHQKAESKIEPFLLKPEKLRDYSVLIPPKVASPDMESPCEELNVSGEV